MKPFLKYSFWAILTLSAFAADSLTIEPNPTGPVGAVTLAQWKLDWPGCSWADGVEEGRFSIVEREDQKRWRVDYVPGEIGPEQGGVGWRYNFAACTKAELKYIVRFSKDFEWVKGGKLPGLGGGPENVSGGRPADGTNGFSARLMWRADGKGEAYIYHKNQSGKYGDSFPFPASFRFPTDTDIQVRLRVEMNDPGMKNGKLLVWVAPNGPGSEQLVVSREDMEWRSVNSFAVDSIYFESFFGGGDQTWAPSRPVWAEFAGLHLSRQ